MTHTCLPNGVTATSTTSVGVRTVAGEIYSDVFNSGVSGLVGQSVLITGNILGASTAIEEAYIPVPWGCTIKSAYADIKSGTTGTGAAVTLYVNDTAGTNVGTASFASAGTAGAALLTIGSALSTALTTGQSIVVVKASCATAYGIGYTIEVQKT